MHQIAISLDPNFRKNAGKMFTDEEIADALGNLKVMVDDPILSKSSDGLHTDFQEPTEIKERFQTTCQLLSTAS